ncbi:hypothetical protein L7F22_063743 [Adiantum nelumboides]|nr:hypothetical protein [Adiantum nelumboides]
MSSHGLGAPYGEAEAGRSSEDWRHWAACNKAGNEGCLGVGEAVLLQGDLVRRAGAEREQGTFQHFPDRSLSMGFREEARDFGIAMDSIVFLMASEMEKMFIALPCRFDFNKDPAFLWIKELPVCAKETIQRSKVLFFNGFLFDEITPDMITSAVDFAHETGCVVFFDPGPRGNSLCKGSANQQHVLQKLLTCSDVLLLTADEAKALTGLEDPTLAAKDLLAKGQRTKWVIVKLGESGCLMVTANSVYTVPAFKVDIKDTVGCGDSFAAAIALGYTRKLPIVSMLALANAVGAATAMGCGAGRNVATSNDVTSILLSSDVCGDCNVIGEVQASSSQQLLKVARRQASDCQSNMPFHLITRDAANLLLNSAQTSSFT